ncbi:alpha/beta hydrolase family esterase [Haliea sp. E17]|uniref:alpha/beta hydrolase family esterase n=1 Tax=Haliea sp. E17 TaxID=3401576 RepID=UPI003AAB2BDC
MSRILKLLALVFVLALISISLLGWWFLRYDVIDPPALAGQMEVGAIEHAGKQRTWRAYVPSSLGTHPPVVFVLHGSQGSGNDMRVMSFYSFDVEAERAGYIAVYPDGYQGHWNDCRASASYAANRENIDDVGFLRQLAAELEQRFGADPQRVYATGLSNGGHMAFRLALEAPDLVRGIAPMAANLPRAENLGCAESGEAVSVMVINGTEDPVNPYNGGMVEILGDDSRGPVRSMQETGRYWAELAGYGGAPETARWPDRVPEDGTTVEVERWLAPGRATVELVSVIGGGHTVPNPTFSLPLLLGPTSHEFDAAEVIWDFFSQAP